MFIHHLHYSPLPHPDLLLPPNRSSSTGADCSALRFFPRPRGSVCTAQNPLVQCSSSPIAILPPPPPSARLNCRRRSKLGKALPLAQRDPWMEAKGWEGCSQRVSIRKPPTIATYSPRPWGPRISGLGSSGARPCSARPSAQDIHNPPPLFHYSKPRTLGGGCTSLGHTRVDAGGGGGILAFPVPPRIGKKTKNKTKERKNPSRD